MDPTTVSQRLRPNDGTFAGALRGVQDGDYCKSPEFHDKQGAATEGRGGAHPKLVLFERKLIKHMRSLRVPMYCERYWDEASLEIVHCRYGWNIPEKAWAILGHMGKEIASRITPDVERDQDGRVVQTTRYRFKWGGDMTRYVPSYWKMVTCIEHANAVPVSCNETE